MSEPTDGEFERGAKLFKERCADCHAIEPGKPSGERQAPNLSRLYGNSFQTFTISKTQGPQEHRLTWDDNTLDKYLKNPRSIKPGVDKIFEPVTKAQDRKDLITYLKRMSQRHRS
ncbi:unnamed protein product [Rhizoctonia solani]|uniref:Cytochrome c domain-containing protein n=1 Tax=Rhizoctonia solani TaxID=456999 RepID=A0A8H3CBY1_9AGAM|nr:unnamed protein product [Rhizoctonia solani]